MRLLSHLRHKQAETAKAAIAHHESFIKTYLAQLDKGSSADERRITIIARSPASPVVCALVSCAEDLKDHGVQAALLLARLEPDAFLSDAIAALCSLTPSRDPSKLLRWANNTAILEAHEQLTLGSSMCWSGDMMRRDPGKRDGLDLFESGAPKTVRLGALAFNAIWSISAPVPTSRLHQRQLKPSGSYAVADAEMPNLGVLRLQERLTSIRH